MSSPFGGEGWAVTTISKSFFDHLSWNTHFPASRQVLYKQGRGVTLFLHRALLPALSTLWMLEKHLSSKRAHESRVLGQEVDF